MDISWRCASRRWPISAPMSRPSARPSRARSTVRCLPAFIGRPRFSCRSTGVFTNTLPTDAYRGAGRPEACYVLERLADRAAAELAIDRAEIRRRNLVPASAMPYKTPIGPTYDCGDFPKVFARALDMADYRGLRAAPEARGARGPAPRHRHGLLCGIFGRRAVALRRHARCAHRILRGGVDPRAAGRRRPGAARHAQSRPGPRHDASRKFSARGSAFRLAKSRSSKATPILCLTAPARSARARSRSAARRSIAPPARSSTKAS